MHGAAAHNSADSHLFGRRVVVLESVCFDGAAGRPAAESPGSFLGPFGLGSSKRRQPGATRTLAYQQALARRHPWPEAQKNLALVESLIPKTENKDKNEEQEISPNLPPDQVKFDEKGKKGKKTQMQAKLDSKKMAEIWMRNIQTTPADFLRRRFAMQAAQESRP